MKIKQKTSERRNAALSKEHIIKGAISILDEGGDDALTFRRLARDLKTGSGGIHHYVANKDDLLSEATNSVLAQALRSVLPQKEPEDQLRAIAFALFDVFEDHPWVGHELTEESRRDGIGFAQITEAIGRTFEGLNVPAEAEFYVASALGSYIIGAANQNAANSRFGKTIAQAGFDRTTYLTQLAKRWKQRLDPEEYKFMHHFLDKVPTHDDREQFIAGIDLMIAGVKSLY